MPSIADGASDAAPRRAPQSATRMEGGTSISKTQFGGGSGGAATLEDSDFSVNTILKQLESIQQGTPKNIVILGTRHCSFLHQQIIELLSYALVLSDNHIFTSGATGTHAAAIRGALRAENPELLTVILPQTVARQPREIRDLIGQVQRVIELGHDQLPLDAASRICNSELLSKGDQLIVFAFHDSKCAGAAPPSPRGHIAHLALSQLPLSQPGLPPLPSPVLAPRVDHPAGQRALGCPRVSLASSVRAGRCGRRSRRQRP